MGDVLRLGEVRAGDAGRVGAKAAALGELIAAGVPVPDGFVVPIPVYRDVVGPLLSRRPEAQAVPRTDGAPNGTAGGGASGAAGELLTGPGTLGDAIEAVELPAPLLAELAEAFAAVCPEGGRVAVRSSATSEDSAAASFAGQYHTELGVGSPADVARAVRRCWASLWQPHAVRYREHRGIARDAPGMAVVVQAMAPADSAGVLFTVDPAPASGREAATGADAGGSPAGHVVIESSWGCGEAVAGGLVTPDRFAVSRAGGRVEDVAVASKPRMVVPAADAQHGTEHGTEHGPGGTTVVDVPPDRRDAPSLSRAQAAELARLGLAIEERFGCPQDVEWAVSGDRVAILQARPLTSRGAAPADVRWDSPVEGAWWARISICDSWLPEPLSPLFATTLFPCLVTNWLRNWAGSAAEQRGNPLLPKPMAGTINGFAYLRLDYPMNKYPLRTLKLALNCYRFHLGPLERRWRTVVLPRHVQRIEAVRRLDLARTDSDAILDALDEAQESSGRYWAILGGLAWYWNAGEWLLAALHPRLTARDADAPAYGTLLQGYPGRTYEADAALHDIARRGGEDGGADRDADGGGEGVRRFEAFLDRYGHQVYHLDFVEPTPAEDPSSFLAAVQAYREGRVRDPRLRLRALAARRDAARARLDRALAGSPLRRGLLEALLRWNRRYGQLRDEALFHFTLGWPFMRRAFLELGRRLARAGALGDERDVFFLTGDELRADLRVLARGDEPGDRSAQVRRRRARREEQKRLSPPAQVPSGVRLFMGGLDVTSVALLGERRAGKAESPGGLRGSPVSTGRVTAPARLVSSVQDFATLQAGDVLVAPYITPAWSPLLAIAGGLVTDTGGALSHGSIVAREYGIPAVMGTGDATKRIRDGRMVTVDGDRGLVY